MKYIAVNMMESFHLLKLLNKTASRRAPRRPGGTMNFLIKRSFYSINKA